ncbi:MAG: serine/threonine-protein kinase [Myxococcota bacterium]
MAESGDTWGDSGDPSGERPKRYEPLGELGRGAMGVVEAVYDHWLKRVVARKSLLRPDRSPGFHREAQVAAGLEHPGIVPIYDSDTVPADAPWYTMRRIDGRSLEEAIQGATNLEQRLRLVPAFLRLCEAMAYAHGKGVVHRDLKPPNVMLGEFGEVVVVDFGLAVEIDGDPGGRIAGTPAYMSPEAALGKPATPASDVWSLGMVLFELLSGARAYPGPAIDVLRRVREHDPPALSDDIPVELRAIVAKACTRDPSQRYPDAGALRADVEAFTTGRLVGAHAYSPRELLVRFVEQYRTPLLTAAIAWLVVSATLMGAWWRTSQALERAVQAEAERSYHLARALESRARAMQGDPAAVSVARQALAIEPDLPWARGVLAQHASAVSFTPDLELPLGDCGWGQEVAGGLLVQCAGDMVWLDPTTGAERDRTPWPYRVEHSGRTWVASSVRDEVSHVLEIRDGGFLPRTIAADVPAMPRDASVITTFPDGRFVYAYDQGDVLQVHVEADGRFVPLDRRTQPPAQWGIPSPDGQSTLLFSHQSARVCDGALIDCHTLPLPGVAQFAVWSDDSASLTLFTTTGAVFGARVDGEPGELTLLGRQDAGTVQGVVGSVGLLHVLEVTGRVEAHDPSGSLVGEIDLGASRPSAIARHDSGFWLVGAAGVQRWRIDRPEHLSSVRAPNGIGALLFDGRDLLASFDAEVVTLTRDGVAPRFTAPTFVKSLTMHEGRLLACTTATGIVTDDGPLVTQIGVRRCGSTGGHLVYVDNDRELRVDGVLRGLSFGDLDVRGGRAIHEAEGRVLEVRDVASWDLVYRFPSDQEVWAVALSEDGTRAAFALDDRLVRQVDLATGEIEVHPEEHLAAVAALRFAPSGRRLASASWDGTSFVWSGGVLTAALEGHAGRVSALAFTSEDVLYTASWDQTIRRWDLSGAP